MNDRRHSMRLPVRLGCLVVAVVLLLPLPIWPESAKFVVSSSPFVAICGLVASGALKAVSVGGCILALVVVFRKRWFCRYICPTGLLQDGASRIGIRKNAWWSRCPPVGNFLVIATVSGALFGYPLFLWMDPLALFSSAFSIRAPVSPVDVLLAAAGLMILLVLAATSGDLWCARICPLGATQELLSRLRFLFRKKPLKPSIPEMGSQKTLQSTRRTFLAAGAGVGMGLLARKLGGARGEEAPLRPPGAIGEETFSGLCLRCGNCLRACPSRILHNDTGQAGIAGLLAPVVRFEKEYCLEDCNACTKVCPSGALLSLSLEQKHRHRIGEALVDGSICLLVQGRSDCDICVRVCPFDAVEVYWDEDLYVAYPNVDFDKCNGCGACQVYCPTAGIKAIRVWRTKQ